MADQYLSNLSITWNQGATTYNAVKIDVTDTASAADSKLMDLQVGSATKIKVDKNGNQTLTSDDTGATAGPVLTLHRDSSSPAASDIMGKVLFRGEDSGGAAEDYAELYATIVDTTATSEDGSLLARVKVAGTMTTRWTATAAGVTLTGVVDIPDGTVGAPSLAFTADGDTGLYRIGANEVGLSAGGVKTFGSTASATSLPLPTTIGGAATLSSTLDVTGAATLGSTLGVTGIATFSAATRHADGSAGAPTISFTSDTDTGFYRLGADNIAMVAGATRVFDATATALYPALPVRGTAGSVTAAGYAFSGDSSTGLYRIGAGNIGIAAGGVKAFDSTSTATTLPLPTTISGAATLSSTLGVSGAATLSSTLGVTGATTLSSTLGVSGATTLSSTLGVSGAATFSGVANIADGTALAPSLAFTSDPDTGVYRIGINNIGLSAGGTKVFDSTASATTLPLATTLSSTLAVTGAATLSGGALSADGAVGSPGYGFSGDTDTGMYRIGINNIGLSAGGTKVFDSTASATTMPLATTFSSTVGIAGVASVSNGTALAPALAFTSDPDTGLYRAGADEVALAAGATKVFGSTATATSLPLPTTIGGAATLSSTLGVTGATTLSSTLGVTGVATFSDVAKVADGAVGAPGVAFNTDTDTGIYRISADRIGIAAGGTNVFDSTASATIIPRATTVGGALTTTGQIRAGDGSATVPGVAFSNDTNTGLYRIGADNPALSAGNTKVFEATTAAFIPALPLRGSDGSVSAPALAFSGDTDTGFYRIGADNLGVAVGGAKVAEFTSTGIVGARPSFLAGLSTSATVSASTDTKLSFDTSITANGITYDTANSRFQAAVAGRWRLRAVLFVASTNLSVGDLCKISLHLNGGKTAYRDFYYNGTGSISLAVEKDIGLSATDYIEVYVQLNGSGNRTVTAGQQFTFFHGSLL